MVHKFGRKLVVGLVAVVWTALLAVGSVSWAQHAGLQTEPPGVEDGVLLLENGQILTGKITRLEKHFIVAVDGGTITVKGADVDCFCRTLHEAYVRQRANLVSGSADSHVKLAVWCQRNGLVAETRREISEAAALDPTHPMLPLLRRRLETEKGVGSRFSEQAPLPPAEDDVATVSSPEELDQLVRRMPPGSVEWFTQVVQPLLINNCTTAGCHGPRSENGFALQRIPLTGPTGRRLTQRNLQTVLRWVDRDNPTASPLLAVPVRPHGSAQNAIFTNQQVDQYKQIVAWVCRVAASGQRSVSAANPVTQASAVEPVDQRPSATRAVYTEPVTPQGSESPDTGVTTGAVDLSALDAGVDQFFAPDDPRRRISFGTPPVERNVTSGRFTPKDPFDPEVFNRRFFADDYRDGRESSALPMK